MFKNKLLIMNMSQTKKELFGLSNCLSQKLNCQKTNIVTKKIKIYSNQHCDDYTTNKGRMINSALERYQKKILEQVAKKIIKKKKQNQVNTSVLAIIDK